MALRDAESPREERLNAAVDAALEVAAGERERVLLRLLSDEGERSAARQILRGMLAMPEAYLEESIDVPTILLGTRRERRIPERFAAGDLIASRFRLEERLGRGASGLVFRARDESAGDEVVALKIFVGAEDDAIRREMTALRRLWLPGVVRIIETGNVDTIPYCAMDYVSGDPFPGRGVMTWSELRPRALRLIELVAAMHARGIVHGDFKPHNVLVDGDRVVVLDLGIASGPSIDPGDRRVQSVGGTLGYMPPEQLNTRPTKAADLYALGVMIVEALGLSPDRIAREISLYERVRIGRRIDLPSDVRGLIESLLVANPNARFDDALALWRGLGGRRGMLESPIPWLGPTTHLERAVERLVSGGSFVVCGPRGSGKTRFAEEVAERLRGCGVEPLLIATDAAGQSVRPDAKDLDQRLAKSRCVVIDDAHELAELSQDCLGDLPRLELHADESEGVRAIADAQLARLPEEDLRALFCGPERLFHLQSDPARVLFALSAGSPAKIASTLRDWIDGGLAQWRDGRVQLERESVDELCALVDDAELLRRGESGAGDLATLDVQLARETNHSDLAERWLAIADRELQAGRPARACAQLRFGLQEARAAALVDVELELSTKLLECTLRSQTSSSFERACHELGRGELAHESSEFARLRVLAEAGRNMDKAPQASLDALRSMPAFDHPQRELLRLSIKHLAARRCLPAEDFERMLLSRRDASEASQNGMLDHWFGGLRYRQGRYAEAVRHHMASANEADSPASALARLLEAATAALETGNAELCRDITRRLVPLARKTRSPLLLAQVEWTRRAIDYRQRRKLTPDLELAEAASQLNPQGVAIAFQEAAIAWRHAHDEACRQICLEQAHPAVASAVKNGIAVLMPLMGLACTPKRSLPPASTFADLIASIVVPDLELQARAFLARLYPSEADACLANARELAKAVPAERHEDWLDVLSVRECLAPERIRLA